MTIINKKELYKKSAICGYLFLASAFGTEAFAGPFSNIGGQATTPTKYEVIIKSIEFYNSTTGAYVPIFSGSTTMDIASVAPNLNIGTVGLWSDLTPGTYDKIRVTLSREFNMIGSASNVGGPYPGTPSITCATGGSGNKLSSGYTVDIVKNDGTTAISQKLTVPSEAQNDINSTPGMEYLSNGNIRTTSSISNFTVLADKSTQPDVKVQFDVANTLEFLNDISGSPSVCLGIVLPPVVTIVSNGIPTTYKTLINN